MTRSKNITNPFPGLRPFESDEYRLFFGREGQSDALISRLQRSRFLAVVGTSGSGKSSLVRAGLLPALRGGMMAGAGSGWRIAVMRPGSDPIGNLALALAKEEVLLNAGGGLPPAEVEAVIEAALRRGSLGMVEVARQARLTEPEKLLVVVDQFEELFRFRAARESSNSDDASAFVKLLLEASQQREFSIYVVPTMRSDFLGDCAQFQGLPEAINDGQYLIPRMTRDERRFAVSGPVGVTRSKITEPLVNRLLNDVGDNPDQLPILQHAMMRTWDHWSTHRRNGEPIGLEHYEAVGTMSAALSRHANEACEELDERGQIVAELLFKALTERGPDNREIRRPTSLQDICAITNTTAAEVIAVIDVFRAPGRSFLMPPAGVALKPEDVVDISHESLIRNWDRLKAWVDDEAQSARIYRRLAEAATDHYGKRTGLLDDATLQYMLSWHARSKPNWHWGVRYHPEYNTAMAYLERSSQMRDVRIEVEQERERRELETARALAETERQRAEERAAAQQRELEQTRDFAEKQARSAQRLRRFTFALVLISLLAFVAAGTAAYAYRNAKTSQRRAEDSEKRTLALAGDLAESQRSVEVGRHEVEAGRNLALALRQKADEKEQQALAEQKKAAEATAAAETATAKAKEAQADANRTLIALSNETEISRLNREALDDFQRGNMEAAEKTFQTLVTTYSTVESKSKLAWAKSHVGETRRQLGKSEESIRELETARKLQEDDALNLASTSKEDAEKRDADYLDTLNWLAQAYTDKGRYAEAQPLYEKALEIRPSAERMKKLARNFLNLGQFEEAEKYYNEALELRRKNPLSPDLTSTLREVAQFYLEQDEHGTAIKLYEEALTNQEAYLEPYDPNIAETFTGLAQVYEETPYKQRAKLLNGLAREIRRSGLTRRDPDPDNFAVLADSYASVGKYRQAGRLLLRAQEIEDGKNGPQAPHSLIRRGDFFGVLAQSAPEAADSKKFYAEGVSTYNRALEISTRSSQLTSRLEALDGLANIHLAQRNFAEAERFYKLAVETQDQTHQATDIQLSVVKDAYKAELAVSLYGLGRAAAGLEKYTEAEAHFNRTQEVLAGLQGFLRDYVNGIKPYALFLQHASRARLAEIYGRQGRVNEAGEQYRPLAETLKASRGDVLKNENIAQGYLDIVESAGKFYAERGDVAAAESFYQLVFPREAWPTVQTIPVWPEAYSKSLVAMAPTSSLDSMVRILEAYEALLEKAGRTRDAGFISHGLASLAGRKVAEEGRPPRDWR